MDEKEFFHKQALDAKRKNKLLKIAIGRMQSETALERPSPEMLGAEPEQPENLKDNTFLTGTNIEDRLADEAIDNIENSQALVE